MNAYLEEMARSLRQTPAFQNLPAINNRQAVWDALNGTLLQLRMPLYHRYLRKPVPKDKDFDVAIQSGLTILQAFAATAATRQIIVRFTGGRTQAVSFQPRPSNANWTADHLLQPGSLLDPDQDPLTAGGGMPQVRTSDMLFLAHKVAWVHATRALKVDAVPDGTATFQFEQTNEGPTVRLAFRPHDLPTSAPSYVAVLRA
jgi:hypothetical protein